MNAARQTTGPKGPRRPTHTGHGRGASANGGGSGPGEGCFAGLIRFLNGLFLLVILLFILVMIATLI